MRRTGFKSLLPPNMGPPAQPSPSSGGSIIMRSDAAPSDRPRLVRPRLPTRSAWLHRVAVAPAQPPCRRRRSPEGFRLAGC